MCRSKYYKNKVISMISTIIIIILMVIGVLHYNDYLVSQSNYLQTRDSVNDQLNQYMYSIIKENQDKAKIIIKDKTLTIQNKILSEYEDDNEELQNDIINPSEDSKLTSIISSEIGDLYINKNDYGNKPFVGSSKNIIWNKSAGEYSYLDKDILTWQDMIYDDYNQTLAEESIECILKTNIQKYDFIIWQNKESNLTPTSMDLNEIISDLENHNYNISELKAFEILVPLYITEDGDIFGITDINSLGLKNDNLKIIIVQRLNMYDIVSPYEKNIQYYINEINIIDNNIIENKRDKITMTLYILLFIVGVICISGNIQNNIKK